MTSVNDLLVSEKGTYQLQFNVPCATTNAATLALTIPSPFTASATSCSTNCQLTDSQHITLTNIISSSANAGASITVQFYMINPPTAITVPTTFTFSILGSDTGGIEYTSTASFSSSLTFQSGTLNSFTITPTPPAVGSLASYKFTMTANHPILAGSVVTFTFPSGIDYSSASLGDVYISTTQVTTAVATIGSLTITGVFGTVVASGTSFYIVLNNIVNPMSLGIFSAFTVTISSNSALIDTSNAGSISITSPASATLSINIGSSVNSATNVLYKFTYSSPFSLAAATYMLAVTLPSQVSCTASSAASLTTNVGNPSQITGFTYNLVTSASITSFQFSMTCTNPPTTQPSDSLTVLLSTSGGSNILTGSSTVTTSIGSANIAGTLSNTPAYPTYPSLTTLTLTRSSGLVTINRIQVTVPNLNTINPCTVDTGSYTCTYPGSILEIDYNNPAPTSLTIVIRNINATNPSTPALAAATTFKVETFVKSGTNYYLVEHLDSAGSLTVTCSSPCMTCGTPTTSCNSCIYPGTSYLYYPNNQCSPPPCTAGYVIDNTGYNCNQCVSPCAACSGTAYTCTSCIAASPYLLMSTCVANCGNNYYLPSGQTTCQQCTSPCYNCAGTATTCTSCISGNYLQNGVCAPTCPVQTYGDISTGKCLVCDVTACYGCTGSATTCTSCFSGSYLFGTTCVTQAACIADGTNVTSGTNCVPCTSPCSKCQGTASTCTACGGGLALSLGTCSPTCQSQYYNLNGVCAACSVTCNGCVTTASNCISCQTGSYLEQSTNQCVKSCATNYYISGNNCLICDNSCQTCSQNALSCTSCAVNLYLSGNKCVTTCPATTFSQGSSCIACSPACSTCSTTSTYCLTCPANMYLSSNTCVVTCPDGTASVNSSCQQCNSTCKTCAGTLDYCTSCVSSSLYVYGGKCYTTCPSGTLASQNTSAVLSCVNCIQGCDSCIWASINSTNQNCSKCSSTYKILSSQCYYVCPDGYTTSSDGLSCIKSGGSNNNQSSNSTTQANTSAASTSSLPFPHIIAAGCLGVIGAVGSARDYRSRLLSNIAVFTSAVAISAFCFQGYFAYTSNHNIVLLIDAIAVGIQIILNLSFLFFYKRKISTDVGFIPWASAHSCTNTWIVSLSTTITYQFNRFYFSRFVGYSLFFVPFNDFMNIFDPLNYFSIVSILFSYFPVLVVDIMELLQVSWGSSYCIETIETFIISAVMIGILCVEIALTKKAVEDLKADSTYSAVKEDGNLTTCINEMAAKPFNEEELRRRIVDEVFSCIENRRSKSANSEKSYGRDNLRSPISFQPKKKPKRRRSLPTKHEIELEKDGKKTRSYPCSPRTEKQKEVPVEQYIPEAETPNEMFPNNVYAEAKEISDPNIVNVRSRAELGVQTPPFNKLIAFKKHLQAQEINKKRRGKKLFEFDANGDRMGNPLEVIQETPEDLDENSKFPNKEQQKAIQPEIVIEGAKPLSKLPSPKPQDKGQASISQYNIPNQDKAKAINTTGQEEKKENVTDTFLFDLNEASPSLGEKDMSKISQNRKNVSSPPQRTHDIPDNVISEPLNLINQSI